LSGDTTNSVRDIQNKDEVYDACRGVDAIIHTAALPGRHYNLNYPREAYADTNIYGTLNLLNRTVGLGVKVSIHQYHIHLWRRHGLS
jgi:UDP-glucose 4-epimerase